MRTLSTPMRTILVLAMVAGLAACPSTPTQPDAPAQAPAAAPAAPAPATPAKPQAAPAAAPAAAPTPAARAARPSRDQRSVFYDFDVYTIKDEFKGLVEANARYLADNPGTRIVVQGNTDERGSREYNLALGQRRADGVRRALTLLGAKENQVEAVSFGEEKPRAAGHSEQAWSQNRRSDIVYSGE